MQCNNQAWLQSTASADARATCMARQPLSFHAYQEHQVNALVETDKFSWGKWHGGNVIVRCACPNCQLGPSLFVNKTVW